MDQCRAPFLPEHRPHGTLANCSNFVDPMCKVIAHDPRWNKDIRVANARKVQERPQTVSRNARAENYGLILAAGVSNRQCFPRGLSETERTVLRRCSQSVIGRAPPPPTPPFRLGGRVGGSGTPGARAERWHGRTGDEGWAAVMDGFEQAPAVRARLHVKAEFPFRPPPEPPFVRYSRHAPPPP